MQSGKRVEVFKHILEKLFVWEAGRGRGTETFHLLVYSINSHSGWGWARPKPGARRSSKVSHMLARTQALEPTAGFTGTLAGSWIWNKATGFNWFSDMECLHLRQHLSSLWHNASLFMGQGTGLFCSCKFCRVEQGLPVGITDPAVWPRADCWTHVSGCSLGLWRPECISQGLPLQDICPNAAEHAGVCPAENLSHHSL